MKRKNKEAGSFNPVETTEAKSLSEQIHKRIDSLLSQNLQSKKKDSNNFFELLAGLRQIKSELKTDEEAFLFDRSWDENQIKLFLDAFENITPDSEKSMISQITLTEFLTTRNKYDINETETSSELLAKEIIKRIESGQEISIELENQIRIWFQNIQMIESNIRLNLILTILNNPGKISPLLKSEAMANLGFYGEPIVKSLQENFDNFKDNGGKLIRIIQILDYIKRLENPGFEEGSQSAKDALDMLYHSTDLYFPKKVIEKSLRPNIPDYSLSEKKSLIGYERHNIESELEITLPQNLGDLDNETAEEIFNEYMLSMPGYASFLSHNILQEKFHEENLSTSYTVRGIGRKYFSYNQREFDQSVIYSRISKNFAVIYSPSEEVDSFFRLDEEKEKEVADREKKYGKILFGTLDFFNSKFKKAIEEKRLDNLLGYIQIRLSLPEHVRQEIETKTGLIIPEELNRDFETVYEFDQVIEKKRKTIIEEWEKIGIDKLEIISTSLEKLLDQRRNLAEKKQNGFSSERTDLLDFFYQLAKNQPANIAGNKHFSICYYLYLRKHLPNNLTEEFEKKFSISVPDNLGNFYSFDDYLKTDDSEIMKPFSRNLTNDEYQRMSDWLCQKIQDLKKSIEAKNPAPKNLTLREVLFEEGLINETMDDEDLKRVEGSYRALINPEMRKKIEEDFNIKLSNFSVRNQVQFIDYISNKNEEEISQLINFIRRNGENGFVAFLACEYGTNQGEIILNLDKNLSADLAEQVFSIYAKSINVAQEEAKILAEQYKTINSDLKFNEKIILEFLIARAKDLLNDLDHDLEKTNEAEKAIIVRQLILELESEDPTEKGMRSQFKKIAEIFGDKNVDLESLKKSQRILLNSFEKNHATGTLLKVLQRTGRLRPIPEIHWRVDRSVEEYDRRLGVDTIGLLKDLAPQKGKGNLLEFGPGSGLSKRQRAKSEIGDKYDDFAIADCFYYSTETLISELIDFEKVEQAIGEKLSPEEKKVFTEFIYKTIYIKKGQTQNDYFEYDAQEISGLINDPDYIKTALKNIGQKLDKTTVVPQTISSRDANGQVIYPYKIESTKQSLAWQKAMTNFGNNPQNFLREDIDQIRAVDLIDAFPAGTMIGDFDQIKKIKSEQIDVALGVRSTVYLKGEKYIDFLKEVARTLKDDGIYIDDNIRDNDGWYYRIKEISEFVRQINESDSNVFVSVILGPGFAGEDYRQDLVPLSLIITKNNSHDQVLSKHLNPGCKIVSFDELENDKNYLLTLDKTGQTASMPEKTLTDAA